MTYKLRPEEQVRLRTLAAEVGVGPSTFAADAVRRAIGTERRRAAPQVPFAITLAVRDATGQLGSIGKLLSQLTRRVHLGGAVPSGELAAIRDKLASIADSDEAGHLFRSMTGQAFRSMSGRLFQSEAGHLGV